MKTFLIKKIRKKNYRLRKFLNEPYNINKNSEKINTPAITVKKNSENKNTPKTYNIKKYF